MNVIFCAPVIAIIFMVSIAHENEPHIEAEEYSFKDLRPVMANSRTGTIHLPVSHIDLNN